MTAHNWWRGRCERVMSLTSCQLQKSWRSALGSNRNRRREEFESALLGDGDGDGGRYRATAMLSVPEDLYSAMWPLGIV